MKAKVKMSMFLAILFIISSIFAPNLPIEAQDLSEDELIQLAGNSEDERTCLEYLKKLQNLPGLDSQLKKDVDKLVVELDKWVNTEYLRYYEALVKKDNFDYDLGVTESSPVYPIACLYRAKMTCWATIEMGLKAFNEKEKRRQVFDRVRKYLEIAKKAFPNNRIIRMYLGEPIPSDKKYSTVKNAPEWAVYQRENLERLMDITEWWIDNRQQKDGSFRGGWGDDCEMWRSIFLPMLIGFEDSKLINAQKKLSEAIMQQGHMTQGYTSIMQDVEHTSEDSADSIMPMMLLFPEEVVWSKRALKLADLMESLWTGKNNKGFTQFKSIYFTANKVDESQDVSCDTVYHPKVMRPAFIYWLRTGDQRLTKLFSSWMNTWVDATASEERGKPAGLIPSAIHWPDGHVGGNGENWWNPTPNDKKYGGIYSWPSNIELMEETLLLTYHMTKDEKYLMPLRSMADIFRQFRKTGKNAGSPEPGSFAWYGKETSSIQGTLAKYRLLTGKTEFDDLLSTTKSPYLSHMLAGNRSYLIDELKRSSQYLSVNFPSYTSEVRGTDRILSFAQIFTENSMYEKALSNFGMPGTGLLYSSVTGDPGSIGAFPMNAVQWGTNPRDIAALVTATGDSQFKAELFHFGKNERPMSAKLFLLKPGQYDMVLRNSKGTALLQQKMTIKKSGDKVAFKLPANDLCTLEIKPVGKSITMPFINGNKSKEEKQTKDKQTTIKDSSTKTKDKKDPKKETPINSQDKKTPSKDVDNKSLEKLTGKKVIEAEFNCVKVTLDSKPVQRDNITYNGVIYAPIIEIANLLGKRVTWNDSDSTLSISENKKASIKESKPGKELNEAMKKIEVTFNGVKVIIDGKTVDVNTLLYKGYTFVPIDEVAKLFGKKLDKDSKVGTINIK